MAFFPSSSGFVINGGNFINFQKEEAGRSIQVFLSKSCDCMNMATTNGLMILKAGDVELRRELISDGDNSYRIHAASHGGRLVAVKTFEGPSAKQDWKVNVAFSKKSLGHPNVLRIVGISDESSESHFIQFHGITSEQKMQWQIANALGVDLNSSVQLSMKAVKGIAAGLSYIKSQKIPVMYAGTVDNNQMWDNFDILTGYDNEPIIAFHLSSTVCEDSSVSQNLDIGTDIRGIEVLNGLCNQLFSGANSVLYDDSPERDFDVYDSEGLPAATLEHEESTTNLSETEAISNRSNPMENPKPSRKPRREVWWVDLGSTNHSLKSIGRCFEDRLNWSLLSSSNSLLHHVRSPKVTNLRQNLHQCPGYLREEITLSCDLSKSAIVSYAFPAPSERCSICHQLVQYTHSDSVDCNDDIYYDLRTLNSSLCLPPAEGALTFDHFAPVGLGSIDPLCNIAVNSSNRMRKTATSFGEKLLSLLHLSRAPTPSESSIEMDPSSDNFTSISPLNMAPVAGVDRAPTTAFATEAYTLPSSPPISVPVSGSIPVHLPWATTIT